MLCFDPSYGYTLDRLRRVASPPPPEDFAEFWRKRFQRALAIDPSPILTQYSLQNSDFEGYDLHYRSTDGVDIEGWVLLPRDGKILRGVVVGHGYGGRDGPDFHLPIANAAYFFPCFRGLARSRRWPFSSDPSHHVLHDIQDKDRYVLGGCVEDLWIAISALLSLFPAVEDHVGFLGISFSGGIGALALPWDGRVRRAHFNVPTFGHHPLRLELPTWGSAAALQNYHRDHGDVLATLSYFDASVAARFIKIPVHVAAALADPMVAPPGQFSIYNALPSLKRLFVLDHGHSDYPQKAQQEAALIEDLREFFAEL